MMKSNLLKLTLLTGVLGLAGLGAFAGPLDRNDLPAEPAWIVHVDFDGLRASSLGQYALKELDKPELQAKLAAFQQIFSLDLRTQLHGATLYSTGSTPQDGVLLVYAEVDPERLVILAQAASDYQSTNHNQYVIHN
jgi:hypothetical protein